LPIEERKSIVRSTPKAQSSDPRKVELRIGRVWNKFLILEVFGMYGYRDDEAGVYLWKLSYSMRNLMIRNHYAYLKIIENRQPLRVTHIS
jgi:hypothetical protein